MTASTGIVARRSPLPDSWPSRSMVARNSARATSEFADRAERCAACRRCSYLSDLCIFLAETVGKLPVRCDAPLLKEAFRNQRFEPVEQFR